MCVIIEIKRGQEFPERNLRNAIMNNKDGFGIIVLDNKKLRVERFVDEKGNDLDHVKEVLKSYQDKDLILHLRHNTKGTTTKENTHPFLTLSDDKNSIYMMHNGTMFEYFNKLGGNDKDNTRSDTQLFNEYILRPYLQSLKPRNGKIILDTEINRTILSKLTPPHNRIVIVNQGQPPLYVGDWSEFKSDDQTFKVSNESYFHNSYARGQSYTFSNVNNRVTEDLTGWYDRQDNSKKESGGREVALKKQEAEKASVDKKENNVVTPFPRKNNTGNIDCISQIEKYLKYDDNGTVLSDDVKTLLSSTSKYLSYSDIHSLAHMETTEIMDFMIDDDNQPVNYNNLVDVAELVIATSIEFINKCEALDKLNDQVKKLEEKLHRATNRIATLTKEAEEVD